ncbi:MAG: hypothetical protein LAO55_13600 [Acidobacteriia bacterium]|nr:hypothetical protein [Terriglobia bacterium]
MTRYILGMAALAAMASAQWPNQPTPGVPRTADGKPNLSAPAPRAPDGKPDLSGVWRPKQASYLFYVTSDLKPEEILPWAAALYQQRADDFRKDSDGIACLPPGPKAGISGGGLPAKIVQTPGLVVILYEYQTIYRQIFTDGRKLPDDPNPTWMGYSVGHWEGDTLVVTTAGYNDRTTIDLAGHPHTESLRVTERFRRRDAGHIDLQVTLEDPKAYARAWTLPIELDLVADGDLIEYVCEDRSGPHLVGKRGDEFKIAPEVLAKYAGVYGAAGRSFVVTLEESRLMINQDGDGKIPLFAISETSFTQEGTGIEFVKDAQGAVTGLIQRLVEGDRLAVRRK